jgi:hypothetical protein
MKYQFRRQYLPRRYNQPYQQQSNVSGAIDTGSKFGEQVAKAMAQAKQNKIADQLAAQYGLYAPRAQWVGGTQPAAGVDMRGTSLADQGGVEGLKLRMAMANQQRTIQDAQAKQELARAVAAGKLAGGSSSSRWTKSGSSDSAVNRSTDSTGKTAKYVPNSYDAETGTLNGKRVADSMAYLRADIDENAGKGATDKLLAAIPLLQNQGGKLVVKDSGQGGTPQVRVESDGSLSFLNAQGGIVNSVRPNTLNQAIKRYNALQVRNNGSTIPDPSLTGRYPDVTIPPGNEQNPYVLDPKNPNLTLKSIPNGKWFVHPDGRTIQKTGPDQPQQQTPPATASGPPNVPASQFPVPSEGGTDTNLLRNPAADLPSRNATLPGHVPTRPTASSDESGGLAQNVGYRDGQQLSPLKPDPEVGHGTGGTPSVWDPLYGYRGNFPGRPGEAPLSSQGTDLGGMVGLREGARAFNDTNDRVIVPDLQGLRPRMNVPAPQTPDTIPNVQDLRNPRLQAANDAVLPNTANLARADTSDSDLLAEQLRRQQIGEQLLAGNTSDWV